MRITLRVIDGPHTGLEFAFARHDTFLVGRSRHAHFQLPVKDKYFSRIHFMVEVNPPQCRIVDMGSHNGTYVNGHQVLAADLKQGDQIRAGHTVLQLSVQPEAGEVSMAPALPTAGHAPEPAVPGSSFDRPLAVPEAVPGFELVRELGRGGLGVVFLAVNLADQARVALKAVAPSVTGTPVQVERFLHDVRELAQLDHPHIARFHKAGQVGPFFYFVTEYVHGADAGALLRKDGPFPLRRAVRLVCQVLQALEYAHARNFIHRDIKPANLLVAEQWGKESVKLTDYGLARVYQASQLSGLTMTGDIAADAAFMPPEQITNYQAADPPADQYAAAATLYTLLTAQHVYDLPREIPRQFSLILEQQPVPIQSRRPDIPPALAAAIHKALARNPSQRFASATAFRKALVKAVTGSA